MIERIVSAIVDNYRDYDGLDEIKRGLNIAIAVSGMRFSREERNEMLDEILYRLAE